MPNERSKLLKTKDREKSFLKFGKIVKKFWAKANRNNGLYVPAVLGTAWDKLGQISGYATEMLLLE
jgi:hypothetical protein